MFSIVAKRGFGDVVVINSNLDFWFISRSSTILFVRFLGPHFTIWLPCLCCSNVFLTLYTLGLPYSHKIYISNWGAGFASLLYCYNGEKTQESKRNNKLIIFPLFFSGSKDKLLQVYSYGNRL